MKFNKWRFIRDRMYEIYASLKRTGFFFAVTIADVDFEIHLINCRDYDSIIEKKTVKETKQ